MKRPNSINFLAVIALIASLHLPVLSIAQVEIEDGLDVFKTKPCDGAVDLPALPAGFFGAGSKAVAPCPDFRLVGHPFPDVCGPPVPFPKNEYRLQITWRDQHGNEVSADSVHRVSQNVRRIIPNPPYNFDTVVARGPKGEPGAPMLFEDIDDEQMSRITFCWLSLKGCEKKEVEFEDGSTKMFEVFICMSDTPQAPGRMKFVAKDVRSGGGSGTIDLGDSSDSAAGEFESGNFNFFEEDPNALGLPLFYKVVFIECENPSNRIEIDDPDGSKTGFKTTVLWNHNPPPGSKSGDGSWEMREEGRLCLPEVLDCWATAPGGASVELPELGEGFFGWNPIPELSNPSNPIPGGVMVLEGWPFDAPLGPPRPENRPEDKLETVVVWRDQHGNIVGPDSIHAVTQTTEEVFVRHDEPRSYDTVVRRGGACFDDPGESHDVPIEIVELSLRSVEPIEVSFQSGPNRFYDVLVTLSDTFEMAQQAFLMRGEIGQAPTPFVGRRQLQGRIRMTADSVNEAGGEVELAIGNQTGSQQFDEAFENILPDPMAFDTDFGFLENPDALGLPVMYALYFFEVDPLTRDFIDADAETPQLDPANHLDSPFGQLGIPTASLFHNEMGGFLKHFQVQPGDMNGDGVVDHFDVELFILSLIDTTAFKAQSNLDPHVLRDCNGDGKADNLDIDCFIALVLGIRTIEDFWRDRMLDKFGDSDGDLTLTEQQLSALQALVPDPLMGGIPVDGLPGWYFSPWFGFYNTFLAPWIFHAEHGFIYRYPESTNEGMFFYDNAMAAWWWTNIFLYPFIYAFDPPPDLGGIDIEAAWLFYFLLTGDPRVFSVLTGPFTNSFLTFGP